MNPRRWRLFTLWVLLLAGIAVVVPPDAFAAGGVIAILSLNSNGEQGDGGSTVDSISADGRFAVLSSSASNFAPGDSNGFMDIFVRDRQTGDTDIVSISSTGGQGNDLSILGAISDDGRFIAFQSDATNLISDDTNGWRDVLLRDRQSGTTVRIPETIQPNGISESPSISADGRYIAFRSNANNLVQGDSNFYYDIFVYDRITPTITRVSVATDGTAANGHSSAPVVSADGAFVVFASAANNLVAEDTNGREDIFVHERATGTTARVSVASNGTQANNLSGLPSISADGRYISFQSEATNLIAGGTAAQITHAYVHDRATGITTLESVTAGVYRQTTQFFKSSFQMTDNTHRLLPLPVT